jgi:hypothetical protein
MAVILLLPHGANSSQVLPMVVDDLMELQTSLLHHLFHQRRQPPQCHHQQLSSDPLQVQQPNAMSRELYLLLKAEKLYVINATAVGTLLLNAQARGPCC